MCRILKLADITVDDIKNRKSWRLISYDTEDLELAEEINRDDYIYHSAVAISKNGKVFPAIITKSYDDGGEVGEYYIYYQGKWQILSPKLKKLEIEEIYFSNPQKFDMHLNEEEQSENISKYEENIKKII